MNTHTPKKIEGKNGYGCAVCLSVTISLLTCLFTVTYCAEKPFLLFFYSPDCDDCKNVKRTFLPQFLAKNGKYFTFIEMDISNEANFDSLLSLESLLSIPDDEKDSPAIYFLGTMLEGEKPIRLRLNTLVRNYLTNPDSAFKFHRKVISKKPFGDK